jgi:hypothetical protein
VLFGSQNVHDRVSGSSPNFWGILCSFCITVHWRRKRPARQFYFTSLYQSLGPCFALVIFLSPSIQSHPLRSPVYTTDPKHNNRTSRVSANATTPTPSLRIPYPHFHDSNMAPNRVTKKGNGKRPSKASIKKRDAKRPSRLLNLNQSPQAQKEM